jgi:hypothetical protein
VDLTGDRNDDVDDALLCSVIEFSGEAIVDVGHLDRQLELLDVRERSE